MPKATQVNFSDIKVGDTVAALLRSVGLLPEYFPPGQVFDINYQTHRVELTRPDTIHTYGFWAGGTDITIEFYRVDNPSQTR